MHASYLCLKQYAICQNQLVPLEYNISDQMRLKQPLLSALGRTKYRIVGIVRMFSVSKFATLLCCLIFCLNFLLYLFLLFVPLILL